MWIANMVNQKCVRNHSCMRNNYNQSSGHQPPDPCSGWILMFCVTDESHWTISFMDGNRWVASILCTTVVRDRQYGYDIWKMIGFRSNKRFNVDSRHGISCWHNLEVDGPTAAQTSLVFKILQLTAELPADSISFFNLLTLLNLLFQEEYLIHNQTFFINLTLWKFQFNLIS